MSKTQTADCPYQCRQCSHWYDGTTCGECYRIGQARLAQKRVLLQQAQKGVFEALKDIECFQTGDLLVDEVSTEGNTIKIIAEIPKGKDFITAEFSIQVTDVTIYATE